jgi:hypothetical protein
MDTFFSRPLISSARVRNAPGWGGPASTPPPSSYLAPPRPFGALLGGTTLAIALSPAHDAPTIAMPLALIIAPTHLPGHSRLVLSGKWLREAWLPAAAPPKEPHDHDRSDGVEAHGTSSGGVPPARRCRLDRPGAGQRSSTGDPVCSSLDPIVARRREWRRTCSSCEDVNLRGAILSLDLCHGQKAPLHVFLEPTFSGGHDLHGADSGRGSTFGMGRKCVLWFTGVS